MTDDRRTLWLALLFMFAGAFLLASLFFGAEATVQLGQGPVLLTSLPQISADSQRVVYARADGLFSAPLAGGAAVRIVTIAPGRKLFGAAKITPDSARVVFIADLDTLGKPELFSVPITGGSPTRISKAMAADRQVRDFILGQSQVYYAADADVNNMLELFRVPFAGGESKQASHTMTSNYDVFEYAVGGEPERVIYRSGRSDVGGYELHSAPANGTPAQSKKINRTMVTGGGVDGDFKISRDGSRVVYRCDCEDNGRFDLYSVAVAGGVSTRLNVVGGDVVDVLAEAVEGTTRVVYQQRVGASEVWFSVPVTGGVPVPVPPPVEPPITSPDGRWYATHAASVLSLTRHGCTTQIGMPVVTTFLSRPAYSISPDSKRVVFISGGDVWASEIRGSVCLIFKDGFESGSTEAWQ